MAQIQTRRRKERTTPQDTEGDTTSQATARGTVRPRPQEAMGEGAPFDAQGQGRDEAEPSHGSCLYFGECPAAKRLRARFHHEHEPPATGAESSHGGDQLRGRQALTYR